MDTRSSRIRLAQACLYIDVFTIEVLRGLHGSGVRALVLKGPAIASWLYEANETRAYVDSDLYVDPAQMAEAEDALTQLGFERLVDTRVAEEFAEPHAINWRRRRDGAAVDLHWRIPGIPADPQHTWTRLSSETEQISLARSSVEVLGEPARTLHVALHALHNGRESEKSMADLARGVERLAESTWRLAAELASQLDSTDTFAAGLRLTAEGDALADRLELPREMPERLALWAQTASPGAVRLHALVTTPGVLAKARALGAAIIPPPDYMRALYPSARRSSASLALAYARRPFAGIRQAPGAFRALRRARAEARMSERGT